jgi:hypothetical protein
LFRVPISVGKGSEAKSTGEPVSSRKAPKELRLKRIDSRFVMRPIVVGMTPEIRLFSPKFITPEGNKGNYCTAVREWRNNIHGLCPDPDRENLRNPERPRISLGSVPESAFLVRATSVTMIEASSQVTKAQTQILSEVVHDSELTHPGPAVEKYSVLSAYL